MGKKAKISLAAAGVALVGAGAQQAATGNTANGVGLVVLGLICIVVAKWWWP